MPVTPRLRSLANILDGRVNLDTYGLLNLLDELDTLVQNEVDEAKRSVVTEYTPQRLARLIEGSDLILALLRAGRKIQAIKALRALDNSCGLKEAKDACEAFNLLDSPAARSLPAVYFDSTDNPRWDFSGAVVNDTNRPYLGDEPPF